MGEAQLPKIISYKEAKVLGLKHFFTGKACKYGHLSKRNMKWQCLKCDAEYKRLHKQKQNLEKKHESDKKWRKEHPGTVRDTYRKYYVLGPNNPRGELQWAKKIKRLLRTAKRINRKRRRGQPLSSIEKSALMLMLSRPAGLSVAI